MYFVVDVFADGYLVADTKDNIMEMVSEGTLQELQQNGVVVLSKNDALGMSGLNDIRTTIRCNKSLVNKLQGANNVGDRLKILNSYFHNRIWEVLTAKGLLYRFQYCKTFNYLETDARFGVCGMIDKDVVFLCAYADGRGFCKYLPDWTFRQYPSCSGWNIKHLCEMQGVPIPGLIDGAIYLLGCSSNGVAKCCSFGNGINDTVEIPGLQLG